MQTNSILAIAIATTYTSTSCQQSWLKRYLVQAKAKMSRSSLSAWNMSILGRKKVTCTLYGVSKLERKCGKETCYHIS